MKLLALTVLGVGFSVDVYENSYERWMLGWGIEVLSVSAQGHFGHPRTPYYASIDSRWWRGRIGRGWYVWQTGNGYDPPVYETVKQKGEWEL